MVVDLVSMIGKPCLLLSFIGASRSTGEWLRLEMVLHVFIEGREIEIKIRGVYIQPRRKRVVYSNR